MGHVQLWALRVARRSNARSAREKFFASFFQKRRLCFALPSLFGFPIEQGRAKNFQRMEFRGVAGLPRCRRRGWSAFADHDWDRGEFGFSGAQSKAKNFYPLLRAMDRRSREAPNTRRGVDLSGLRRTPMDKSFLLLFFKKKVPALLFFSSDFEGSRRNIRGENVDFQCQGLADFGVVVDRVGADGEAGP